MAISKITLNDVEKSLLINSLILSIYSDRFSEEEKEGLQQLKKRLQNGK